MKTKLLLAAVVPSVLYLFLVSQKSEQEVAKENATLRTKVELFMQGKPVKCSDFPWWQVGNMQPNRSILEVHLGRGTITREQFEALSRPVNCWVRESPEWK
jgi:hypothetical protein